MLLKRNVIYITILLFLSMFFFASSTFAAAPDGIGPWADSVLSSSQGLMKNGSAVPAIRSNPNSALGIAEDNTTEGNFFSLGFGGNIALGFDNGISSGVIIVEATNPNYPTEKAKVEVSENGTTWVSAGEVTQDGSVNKPAGVGCAKYVRITDLSNPNDFSDPTADGYDVDGVKATGTACQPPTCENNCCTSTTITQTNSGNITTGISTYQNTGLNKSKGGKIKTGNATTSISASTTANINIANVNNAAKANKNLNSKKTK